VFSVAAEAYDSYMGRFSNPLAPLFGDFALVDAGQRALDVGAGPGALTGELVRRLGPSSVVAADPSEPFVGAVRERHPGVEVVLAPAERLPFTDGEFDATLAQLVVHFMEDPVAGLGEMARVTHAGGLVAACVWDHAGGGGPLSRFWDLARELDPEVEDESRLAGAREGHLAELLEAVGLNDVDEAALSVTVEHESFDEWWEPFTFGVGPGGAYLSSLAPDERARLREHCRASYPEGPFAQTARAWAARGRVPTADRQPAGA